MEMADDISLETMPLDALYYLVENHMNTIDILRLCESSTYFRDNICRDDSLWKRMYKKKFGNRPIDERIADPESLYFNNYAAAYWELPGNSPEEQLYRAVDNDDIKRIQYLLEYVFVNDREDPLMQAIKKGKMPVIETIVEDNSEVLNVNDDVGDTLLSHAIMNTELPSPIYEEIIHYLIEKGADIETADALSLSLGHSDDDTIRYILSKNPVVNRWKDKHDPLAMALDLGKYDIAEELLRHGAYIDVLPKRMIVELLSEIYKGKTPEQIDELRSMIKWKPK